MADYTQQTWVDDDGTDTLGTVITKARMDTIEAGVKDAAQNAHATGLYASRPAASAANKNWFYHATDVGVLYRSDGTSWARVASDSPLGGIQEFIMPYPPPGFLDADGSAISRTTYADLFNAATRTGSGSNANGSNQITNLLAGGTSAQADSFIMRNNKAFIEGPGITTGTKVTGITNTGGGFVTVTLSANIGQANSGVTYKFNPWGFGDGSTTFNLPLLTSRVRVPAGASPPASATQHYVGETGGEETHTLSVSEMPAHAHTGTTASSSSSGSSGGRSVGHTHSAPNLGFYSVTFGGGTSGSPAGNNAANSSATGGESTDHSHSISVSTTTTVSVASQGGGTAHQNMQPYAGVWVAVKAF